jgi:hypothetical protein
LLKAKTKNKIRNKLMLLFYTQNNSPRLQYILQTLFADYLQLTFRVTNNKQEFETSDAAAKINYSNETFAFTTYNIASHGLLAETHIAKQTIDMQQSEFWPYFFAVQNSDHPFDLLAASFYLVSRYEEYLPHQKDEYDRFPHKESIAFQQHFLDKPLVNIWVLHFMQNLQNKFPQLVYKIPTPSLLPTYDIDIAYSIRGKSALRTTTRAIVELFKGKPLSFKQLVNVKFKKAKDPYDAYVWMDQLHAQYGLKPMYFFLVAKKIWGLDKNLPRNSFLQTELMRKIANQYSIAVHPSSASNQNEELLSDEIAHIEEHTKQKINASRQHYIQFNLPASFQRLIKAGISDEYSMGYGSINGFRASFANSFLWYDLAKEETTTLRMHPFCYMEANSLFEQKLTPEQALEEMLQYQQQCSAVGGRMIMIWHNHMLSDQGIFSGWKNVYQQFFEQLIGTSY